VDRAADPMSPIVFQHSTRIKARWARSPSPTSALAVGSEGRVGSSKVVVRAVARPSRRTSSWIRRWPDPLPGVHREVAALASLCAAERRGVEADPCGKLAQGQLLPAPGGPRVTAQPGQLLEVPTGGLGGKFRALEASHLAFMLAARASPTVGSGVSVAYRTECDPGAVACSRRAIGDR